jgi:putative ABC transport system permease protein
LKCLSEPNIDLRDLRLERKSILGAIVTFAIRPLFDNFLVAWRQLTHHRVKLAVAAAGVVVAVMLMLVQLGIRQGAMDNSVAIARRVSADLCVVSPRTKTIFQSSQFPRRLLFRLPAHPEVERVAEMSMSVGRWRNPWEHFEHPISVFALDPRDPLMDFPGIRDRADELLLQDRLMFDGMGRTNYGPVVEHLKTHDHLDTEINFHRVRTIGVIDVGVSISADGNVFVSNANFQRLFPGRPPGSVDLGLVRLKPGADVARVARELRPLLGDEARLLTRDELIAAEIAFFRATAPVDFIFGMGAAVGFFIGFVVVYQILYTEVTNHLPQFATMKAMGFTDGYILRIVLSQALVLSVFGYVPGFWMAIALYDVATRAIQMPFTMTTERAVMVFGLTLVMCGLSAIIAVQKARTADPADVF